MKRSDLKAIVKECLVELLAEGLSDVRESVVKRPASPRFSGTSTQGSSVRDRRKFDPSLDTPVSRGPRTTPALQEAIKREAGGNPIMESIFADTAATTLPTMLQHGDGSGGAPSISQQEKINGTPEEVFGEDVSSRWADLAFTDSPTKKTA